MFAALLNHRLIPVLYHNIPRRLVPALSIRVVQGVFTTFCIFFAIQHLPLTLVSILNNTVPLCTAFLAFLILKERISAVQAICLFLAFYGVFQLIQASGEDDNPNEENRNVKLLPFLVLLCVPIGISTGQLTQRYIRELSSLTSGTYIAFLSVIVFFIAVMIKGLPLINMELNVVDVLLITAVSLFGGSSLIYKAKAFQQDQASKLSIFVYIYVAIMFSFDIFVLGTTFDTAEVMGILIIFCATAVFTVLNFTRK